MALCTFKKILTIVFLSSLLAFVAQTVPAAQVTLTWDAVTDATVTGYKIYYGTASRNYTNSIDVKKVTTYAVNGLQDNTTYYFAATVYNAAKAESGFSNEVTHKTAAAQACTYTLSSSNVSFGASAGIGNVSVTAPSGCTWSASEAASWITLTSGASGTGSGTVAYTVAANTTTSSRMTVLSIAGKIFTVTQAGVAQ
jgi:fibronectin type 3 domain-containing protein